MAAWLSERDSFVFCACRIECETRGNLNLNMCVSCVRWLDCARRIEYATWGPNQESEEKGSMLLGIH